MVCPSLYRPLLAVTLSAAASLGCSDTEAPRPTELGSPAPLWQLQDIQTASEAHGQTYGLERFRGEAVVVGLFSGWCDYCVGQVRKMDQVEKQFRAEGLRVRFIAINGIGAESDQQSLRNVASFPLFQDTSAVHAWRQQGGALDDVFVYNTAGALTAYFPIGGPVSVNAWVPVGYNNLRQAVIAAQ